MPTDSFGVGRTASMAVILIAEDDPAVRAFVMRALELAGHEVTAVADGLDALEALAGRSYDALVSDIVMPGLDGIALALKASKEWPGMSILLMSGYAHERQRAHNLDALSHDVIAKPFTLDAFNHAVQVVLDRRG